MKAYAYNPPILIPDYEGRMRNSYLSTVGRALKGQAQFWSAQKFLGFGVEMHKRILQPSEERKQMSAEQEEMLEAMCNAAAEYRPLQKRLALTPEFMRECLKWTRIDGLLISGQLDLPIYQWNHLDDLKSTVCKSEKEFIEASRKYDYFRQAWVYQNLALNLAALQELRKRKRIPKIYEFIANDFPHYMQEGEEQARLLIDSYKVLIRVQ
jgi:hypothetical protein